MKNLSYQVVRTAVVAGVLAVASAWWFGAGKVGEIRFFIPLVMAWLVVSYVAEHFLGRAEGAGLRRAIYALVDSYLVVHCLVSAGVPDGILVVVMVLYLGVVTLLTGVAGGALSSAAAELSFMQLFLVSANVGWQISAYLGLSGALGVLGGWAWRVYVPMIWAAARKGGIRSIGSAGDGAPATGAAATAVSADAGQVAELRRRLAMVSEQLEKVGIERDAALDKVVELERKITTLGGRSPREDGPSRTGPNRPGPGRPVSRNRLAIRTLAVMVGVWWHFGC